MLFVIKWINCGAWQHLLVDMRWCKEKGCCNQMCAITQPFIFERLKKKKKNVSISGSIETFTVNISLFEKMRMYINLKHALVCFQYWVKILWWQQHLTNDRWITDNQRQTNLANCMIHGMLPWRQFSWSRLVCICLLWFD